jgi:hypothetical protein
MEITAKTKLFDLLAQYPALEDKIIHIAPPFKNLTNPVLRRTVGKLATVEKAAQIGNIDVLSFVNLLRREAGQPELPASGEDYAEQAYQASADDPQWIHGEPQFVVNGTEMLTRGEVPLNKVNEHLGQLTAGRFILLVTNFAPTPMIEALQKQNRSVYHKVDTQDKQRHLTYIQ